MPRSISGTVLGIAAAAVVLVAPLVAVSTASANPSGTGVVIEEAYLKGGSANAPFTNKFVELGNPTSAAVDLAGWSLQYRSATGTGAASVGTLAGSIPAHGTFLVQLSSNGTNGAALPTPDAVTTVNPSGSTGTLVLSDQAAPLTLPVGAIPTGSDGVVDLLGYGTSNTFEGVVAKAGTANSVPDALTRTGTTDTDVNAADFALTSTITPTNAAGETAAPTDPTEPTDPSDPGDGGTTPAPATDVTIAELQGTTDTSPYVDKTVRTTGVVTAVYPTGGYQGYFVQTAGTGGAIDPATHTASDGVFVYSPTTVASVAVGQSVRLIGTVSEFFGLTELNVTSTTGLEQLPSAGVVAPKPAEVAFPRTDAARESFESMLVQPAGKYTVTDVYTTNQYGEVALASGTTPLLQPTEVARPGTPAAAAVAADNAARAITLDDGASTNYLTPAGSSIPVPWLTNAGPVTVGAPVAFTKPVVLDFRNSAWKFEPTTPVTGATATTDLPAAFGNVRPAAPANVGGDIRLAGFNVLNYFPTTGDQLTGCTYYDDREGNPLTVRDGCDARGAANADDLARQQQKIVTAINGLGADVVSLEEIENSARFGQDRDAALSTLVAALNAAAGKTVWAFVPSPAKVPASEDVIRLALIYKKDRVAPQGESTILTDAPAFTNARQPVADAFRPLVPVGKSGKRKVGGKDTTFLVIANHFKSKGSGTGADADQGDGQGASNLSRVNQAKALVTFSTAMQRQYGTDKVFMLGDFNAYSQEDPVVALDQAGYTDLGPTADPTEHSYVFDGLSGSLDHVFASKAALATVTGVDIWNINSVESVGLEYSRYNDNVSDLYSPDQYRASDHDPILVGIDLPGVDNGGQSGNPGNPGQPGHPGQPGQPGHPGQSAAEIIAALIAWIIAHLWHG
ncbi:ExeM/NucH family extracellular endonuclease [Curtobacterium sp. RRHDQ10]|uniref:ExeM/NucH family extracellular endonuclease n=1 Tax=Curtobacterium phyllosphaerae TaxID=3413379 RepID=UPI003BF326B8